MLAQRAIKLLGRHYPPLKPSLERRIILQLKHLIFYIKEQALLKVIFNLYNNMRYKWIFPI